MNLKSSFKKYKILVQKKIRPLIEHGVLVVILVILFVYLMMVWHISNLANAEPSPEAESQALLVAKKIPHVDKEAIDKIQKLEASSAQLRALFNNARSNPFQE